MALDSVTQGRRAPLRACPWLSYLAPLALKYFSRERHYMSDATLWFPLSFECRLTIAVKSTTEMKLF